MSNNMDNIYIGIVDARRKYKEEVYNKTISQLIAEYGSDVFPVWITRFSDPEVLHHEPLYHENIQLWQITESFCYPNKQIYPTYQEFLDGEGQEIKKQYFLKFKEALKYNLVYNQTS